MAAMIHFSYNVTGMGLRPVPVDRAMVVASARSSINGIFGHPYTLTSPPSSPKMLLSTSPVTVKLPELCPARYIP